MKIYAYSWAAEVVTQFRQAHPRVVLLDTQMVRYAKKRGLSVDYGTIESALITAVRLPSLGKYVWKDYKAMVKNSVPGFTDWEEVSRLFDKLRVVNFAIQDEIEQKELVFDSEN